MIALHDVRFAYENAPRVFERFTWRVHAGEAWAVLGPSGCGKTTLLYLLAGLRMPQAGTIRIHDEPLTRPRPNTGLILQDYGLLPWATARENVELGLRIRALYGPDGKHAPSTAAPPDLSRTRAWLERLGLDAVATQYPAQLSGGQRQRVAIARTLALEPDLLLMDEPFSSLDLQTREGLEDLILELWREQNLTCVTVTHSIEEAALLGQKILLLGNPPHTRAVALDNPGAGSIAYRRSPEFFAMCDALATRSRNT